MPIRRIQLFIVVTCLSLAASASAVERKKVFITSTTDGTKQPCYVILPDGFDLDGKPVPLLVSLHTWSNGVEQRHPVVEQEAARRGWIYLFPHFRGPNRNPQACASPAARQDILDAVDWALKTYPIDKTRIYLTGASGGGHMSLVMAARYPERWTAVSAWVPITDLAAWQRFHGEKQYGKNVIDVCGGKPGDSAEVDKQYHERSSIPFLRNAVDLPLEIGAGVHDGYKGSVPIRHTLEAFNVVAKAQGAPCISEEEIEQLSRPNGRLDNPKPSDQVEDPTYGRAIYLRRSAGKARVTIFEGGHERLDKAAIEWLSRHQGTDR